MKKCCLEAVRKFIKETKVGVGDMPAFPPIEWARDKSKMCEFMRIMKRTKEELWVKKYLVKYLNKTRKEKKNGLRKSRVRPTA